MEVYENYLKETAVINYSHPLIQDFLKKTIHDSDDAKTKAIKIYYAVRDGWKYSPYHVVFTKEALQASQIIQQEKGHCIDKAILMLALCRAANIACRLCLGKVANHISTARLEAMLQTNELVPHGYVALYLDGKWVKATPAFNQSLCEKLKVNPLEFDGEKDALLQEYDKQGGVFMEYIEDYGHFEDVPIDFMIELVHAHYPHVFNSEEAMGFDRLKMPKKS